MDRESLKLLWDILEHAKEIQQMVIGITFDEYANDRKLVLAVEPCFEIIGFAMSKLEKLRTEVKITDKEKIIGLRNKLAHSYDDVEHVNIWRTITKDLPLLIELAERLLP